MGLRISHFDLKEALWDAIHFLNLRQFKNYIRYNVITSLEKQGPNKGAQRTVCSLAESRVSSNAELRANGDTAAAIFLDLVGFVIKEPSRLQTRVSS